MTNFVLMGECMVEFSPSAKANSDNNLYSQSFAGDVFNTAVYLKRLMASDVDVSMFTAVGDDKLSLNMIKRFSAETLNSRFVTTITGKTPGAYLIELSAKGERNFVYWRDRSAAKFLFSDPQLSSSKSNKFDELIEYCDVFYFSGISLAILFDKDRFWRLLAKLKDAGAQIVFDSNYRAALWNDKEDAKAEFQRAFKLCDLIFAGAEDFELLYQTSSTNEIFNLLEPMNIREIIVKNGANDIVCFHQGNVQIVKVQAVDKVIDSTAAGDSFNAAYLAKRCSKPFVQHSIQEAAHFGAKVAAEVVLHRGAIVDHDEFRKFTALLK